MPPKPRTKEEVDAVREKILQHALDLITDNGWQGFSMHKLARRLGVKAVTIYNYYENKDHLYIALRTRGFQYLSAKIEEAYQSSGDPMIRLQAMARAYLDFGFAQPNIYSLMFTMRVPMYRDYVGTPMEEAARREYEVSQNMYGLFVRAGRELAETTAPMPEERARELVIYFGSVLHGYVARLHNNLLTYMHDDPAKLREMILETMFRHIHVELVQRPGTGKALKTPTRPRRKKRPGA